MAVTNGVSGDANTCTRLLGALVQGQLLLMALELVGAQLRPGESGIAVAGGGGRAMPKSAQSHCRNPAPPRTPAHPRCRGSRRAPRSLPQCWRTRVVGAKGGGGQGWRGRGCNRQGWRGNPGVGKGETGRTIALGGGIIDGGHTRLARGYGAAVTAVSGRGVKWPRCDLYRVRSPGPSPAS